MISLTPLELVFQSIPATSSLSSPHSSTSSSGLSSGSFLVHAINVQKNNDKETSYDDHITRNKDLGDRTKESETSSLKDIDNECTSNYLLIWRDPISHHVSVSLCSNDIIKSSYGFVKSSRDDQFSSASPSSDESYKKSNSSSPPKQEGGIPLKQLGFVVHLAENRTDIDSSLGTNPSHIDSRLPIAEAMALYGSYLFIAAAPQTSKPEDEGDKNNEEGDGLEVEDNDNDNDDDEEVDGGGEGRIFISDRGARLLAYDLTETIKLLSKSSFSTYSSPQSSDKLSNKEILSQTPCGMSNTLLSLPVVSISFASYSSLALMDVEDTKKETSLMAATRIWIVSCGGEACSVPLLESIRGMNSSDTALDETFDSTAMIASSKRISRWTLNSSIQTSSSSSSSTSSSSFSSSFPNYNVSCAAISSSCYQDPSLSLLSSLFDDATSLATDMSPATTSVMVPKVTLFAGGSSPLFNSYNLSHNDVIDEDSYSTHETSLAAHVSSALSLLSDSIRSPVLSGFAMLFGSSSSNDTKNNKENASMPAQNKNHDIVKQRLSRPSRILERDKVSMEDLGLPGGSAKSLLLFGGRGVGGKSSDASNGSQMVAAPDRVALQMLVDPSQRYLAVATSDSRVFLFLTSDCSVLRVWKGQRNAQLAFIENKSPLLSSSSSMNSSEKRSRQQHKQPLLVIYSPLRGNLTVWPVRTGQAVTSLRVPKGGCIGKSQGNKKFGTVERLFFIAPNEERGREEVQQGRLCLIGCFNSD